MAGLPHNPVWANAAVRRAPTLSEIGGGYQCGPADAELDNDLVAKLQEVDNRLAAQMIYAADQRGQVFDLSNEISLHSLLTTYQDIIKEDLVINVPAQFDDAADALDYLSNFRIARTATVIVNIAAGVYNHGTKVIGGHPDGKRIKVLGPALGAGMVTEANFQVTGFSGANIATDRIINNAMLRGRFGVVIQTTNGGSDTGTGDLTFENICFIGSGANEGIKTAGGYIALTNCAVHNYFINYLVERGGIIYAPGCTASGAVQDGWAVLNNGVIENTGGVSSGNGSSGYAASVGGTIVAPSATAKGNGGTGTGGFFVSLGGLIQARAAVSKNNAGDGYLITNDGFIQARESSSLNNGGYAYNVFNGGRMNCDSSTGTGNTLGTYRCMNFGDMNITGYGGSGTASPTVNTVGNGNCYIKN